MLERPRVRAVAAGLFLLLLVGGVAVGVWNHQQIRSCHEQYDDDDPNVFVECEDAFTLIVYALSLSGVVTGGLGLLSLRHVGRD
jgi:hypothetical protein